MHRANNSGLQPLFINQGPFDNSLNTQDIHNTNEDNNNKDEDDDDIDGPTVDAHVNLSKTACKF
jgi:hypothetical protein